MENLSSKTLALFFTISVSLKTWQKIGSLDREIKPYNLLARKFKKIYFITYGNHDKDFKDLLAPNIEILAKKIGFLPDILYALLIPFLYSNELRETDIYKTNQMLASPPAIIAKWLYKKKLVLRCGYEWLSFLEKRKEIKNRIRRVIVYFLELAAYKTANIIILTSEKDKDFVTKKFQTPSLKIKIIPNYIDAELFKPLNVAKEQNRICFVGGLSYQKNPINLLRAVDNLEVELVLFGKEEMAGAIRKLAKEIKKAKIAFRGNIPNSQLPRELNKGELFLLPSFYEGNPKALLEAMSCGLPCIGANVEGIKEIIQHRENGYLCQTDAESIKKAILEVLSDKALREKMGNGARQTILEKFDFKKVLEKEADVYETL